MNINIFSTPKRKFTKLEKRLVSDVLSNKQIDVISFQDSLKELGDMFIRKDKKEVFNEKTVSLAQKMQDYMRFDMSNTIVKMLMRFNAENPEMMEKLIRMRLNLSERRGHLLGVLDGNYQLGKLYNKIKRGSPEHLEALLNTKNILKTILANYNNAYETLNISNKFLSTYESCEFKLCSTRISLAYFFHKTDPKRALHELEEAEKTMAKYGPGKITDQIELLKNKIKAHATKT